jgi:hypothetical protein
MEIDLSTGAPPAPERTRQLAETFAEIVRVMNHATMDHAALGSPADADRVLREIASAASRLPQLLDQMARWLGREDDAERITVPSGEYRGNPLLAVATARALLEDASATAARLGEELEYAARVTSGLAGVEDDIDG